MAETLRLNDVRRSVALFISIYFPPEIGGGATAAWNRATMLSKVGYSVFVLCGFPIYPSGKVSDPKYKGKFFLVESVDTFTVIRIRLIEIKYQGFTRRLILFLNFVFVTIFCLPKILRITGKVDVVYANQPPPFCSAIGFIYSKFTRSFFIYEVADLWPEQLVILETSLLRMIMLIGKLLTKLSFMTPDMIVTISELAAKYISKEYKPRAAVYGIPMGVDPNKFPKISKNESRDRLINTKVLTDELRYKFIVLYAGAISNNQRIENLAYAAEKLKTEGESEIAILIVGEGDEKQKLQRIKLEQHLENFYILSSQSRDIMPSIISSADCCTIQLSFEPIFDMALPTKFFEYIASAKPMIGICRGELANIINSNNIGRTVGFGDIDSLVTVMRDFKNSPTIMQVMKNNCSKTLQTYSLDTISTRFHHILKQELCEGKKQNKSTNS